MSVTSISFWRGDSNSMVARTNRATGEAFLTPGRNFWSKVGSITGNSGKRTRFSLWKMEKLISHAREQAKQTIYQSLKPYLTKEQKNALDQLIRVEYDQVTELNWLSRKAISHSPESILEVLRRIRRIRELGAEMWDLSHLNRNRLRHLAQLEKRSTNQALQRSKVERR